MSADPNNPFRTSTGQRVTLSLFIDGHMAVPEYAMYNLTNRDRIVKGKLYPSLKKLYLSCLDPTEVIFAQTYLEDYEHWTLLCQSPWFKPYLDEWRHELDLQLKSRAFEALRAIANDPTHKQHYEANKAILKAGASATLPMKKTRGRPPKEVLGPSEEDNKAMTKRLAEDYARIN